MGGKRTSRQDGIDQILLGPLGVEEKKQLVFQDRSAKATAKLIALKRIVGAAGQVGIQRLIAERIVALAVISVAARFRGYVDRSGRSELGGKIERRLLDLKFLDRARRNVLRGCAHGFVADVEPVHFDAGGASETPAKRNGRKTVLGGVEVPAVLDLDSRLQLGEVKKVSSVDRQVLDLLGGKNSLHGGLLGIDCDFGALNFDDLRCLPHLQLDVPSRSHTYLHGDGKL